MILSWNNSSPIRWFDLSRMQLYSCLMVKASWLAEDFITYNVCLHVLRTMWSFKSGHIFRSVYSTSLRYVIAHQHNFVCWPSSICANEIILKKLCSCTQHPLFLCNSQCKDKTGGIVIIINQQNSAKLRPYFLQTYIQWHWIEVDKQQWMESRRLWSDFLS